MEAGLQCITASDHPSGSSFCSNRRARSRFWRSPGFGAQVVMPQVGVEKASRRRGGDQRRRCRLSRSSRNPRTRAEREVFRSAARIRARRCTASSTETERLSGLHRSQRCPTPADSLLTPPNLLQLQCELPHTLGPHPAGLHSPAARPSLARRRARSPPPDGLMPAPPNGLKPARPRGWAPGLR